MKEPTAGDCRDSLFRCNGLERKQRPESLVQRRLARVIEQTSRERLELLGRDGDGHDAVNWSKRSGAVGDGEDDLQKKVETWKLIAAAIV